MLVATHVKVLLAFQEMRCLTFSRDMTESVLRRLKIQINKQALSFKADIVTHRKFNHTVHKSIFM